VSKVPTKAKPQGLRVFLVEDEAIVAMAMEDMLTDLGCIVAGVAGTLAQALNRIGAMAGAMDGAILDVNLGGGEKVYPVADALTIQGVPFIFATGYGPGGVDQRYRQTQILAKPIGYAELGVALSKFREANAH
jgi:CheY-like chemotaxis protein